MISALDEVPNDVRRKLATKAGEQLRADLRCIEAAEKAGWKVTFLHNHWHNSTTFKKGDVIVWSTGKDYRRDVLTTIDGVKRHSGKPEVFSFDVWGLREALGDNLMSDYTMDEFQKKLFHIRGKTFGWRVDLITATHITRDARIVTKKDIEDWQGNGAVPAWAFEQLDKLKWPIKRGQL